MLAAWNNLLGRFGSPDAVKPAAVERRAVVTATALVAAGALPPLALGALMLTAARFAAVSSLPPYDGIALVATAGAAPALTGLAVVRQGLSRARAGLTSGREPPQLIGRILVATAVLASVFGLVAARPREAGLASCLSIAAMALVFAWLLLLHAILRPVPSRLRRHVAAVGDIAMVSGLLHAGGGLTAAWFPLYFCIVVDSGYRFGLAAVAATTLVSLAGFAAMAATTPFWAQQPVLSAGLVGALIPLAAYVALSLRNVMRVRAESGAANIAGGRFLALVGRELHRPVEAILRSAATADPPQIVAEIGRSATALLAQCEDIVELADIEAAGDVPLAEPFDLHELVGGALAAVRAQAAARGVEIALRLDPRVSYRLCGCPRLLRRVLIGLASAVIDRAVAAKVRASLDEIGRDGDAVWLRFAVRADRINGDPEAFDHIGLAVAARVAALLGGRVARVPAAGGGIVLAAEIACEIDRAPAAGLDLGHRPVLIATEDAQFAGELGTALVAWQADPRWIGGLAGAEAHLAGLGADSARAVLIVDGRSEVLQALSRAHRLAAAYAAFVLLVAEESWVGSLVGFADGEIAGILAAPVTPAVLASALHALPYAAAAPDPAPPAAVEPRPAAESRPAAAARPRLSAPEGPLRLLVADDNAANRKIVERILGAAGHTVDLAESGEEMLASLEAHKIDLVLIDINPSGIGGYQAAELCRMTHPGLPILALTADVGTEIARRCAEAGIDAVLTKPIEPSRLIAAVDAALGRGESAPPADEPSAEVHQISSHPRFGADNAAIVDERAVAALWALGRGSDFFRELVEAFRADAHEMLAQIKTAAAAADAPGFAAAVESLRSCAANVGAVRLCDVLGALREAGAAELRRDGAAHVARLTAELAKLNAVLHEYQQEAELAER